MIGLEFIKLRPDRCARAQVQRRRRDLKVLKDGAEGTRGEGSECHRKTFAFGYM